MRVLGNLFLRVYDRLDIDYWVLKLSIEYLKNSIFNIQLTLHGWRDTYR